MMKTILIAAYLTRFLAASYLRWLNLRHLQRHRGRVPQHLEGAADPGLLERSANYTRDQTHFALFRSAYESAFLLLFLFTPLFPLYDAWIGSLSGSAAVRGGLFAGLWVLASSILEIPLSLYAVFNLEKRHGFATIRLPLWMADFLKKSIGSSLLVGVLGAAASLLVHYSPGNWWLWLACLFMLFSFGMMIVAPYLIEPLHSSFEALGDPELEEEIHLLLQRGGLQVKEVVRMDASRRSLHANAYVSGFGSGRRIVLYDTLIGKLGRDELLALVAHEAGHWSGGHLWKKLAMTQAMVVGAIFLAYRLIEWGGVPDLFRLSQGSFPAQVVMTGFLISIAAFPLTPIHSWLSRRFENEADRFAAELTGAPQALAGALMKLSGDNLANFYPHPVYASFYYSHPPIMERVSRLGRQLQLPS